MSISNACLKNPGQRILAKGKTDTGRIWTYVRDDRPFAGISPPAALYYASRDRRQEHPECHLKTFTGILQADAYGGYNQLFKVDRDPEALRSAENRGSSPDQTAVQIVLPSWPH